MASNNGGTEERRRRIAERGSDRMALITGRITTLPPAPPSTVLSPTQRNHIPRHAQSLSVANYDSLPEDDQNLPPRHSRPHSALPFGADFPDDLHGSFLSRYFPLHLMGQLSEICNSPSIISESTNAQQAENNPEELDA